jgi:exonuclease III
MRIVSWNIKRKAGPPRQEAWRFITDELNADIALVQESIHPPDWVTAKAAWTRIDASRPWGSGVFARSGRVTPLALEQTYPGWVQVAEVGLSDHAGLLAVSLHAPIINTYSITSLHRILSDLTLLFEKGGRAIVLGGDFNASRQFDMRTPYATHRILFDRVAAFGLADCVRKFHPDFVQTYRHTQGDAPWEIDHLFVSDFLAAHVTSCAVIDDERVRALSDHNPIVADLDEPFPLKRPRRRRT